MSSQDLEALWQKYDSKRESKLSHRKAYKFVKRFAAEAGIPCSKEDAKGFIEMMDSGGTGYLTFTQFMNLFLFLNEKAEDKISLSDSLHQQLQAIEQANAKEEVEAKPTEAPALKVEMEDHTKEREVAPGDESENDSEEEYDSETEEVRGRRRSDPGLEFSFKPTEVKAANKGEDNPLRMRGAWKTREHKEGKKKKIKSLARWSKKKSEEKKEKKLKEEEAKKDGTVTKEQERKKSPRPLRVNEWGSSINQTLSSLRKLSPRAILQKEEREEEREEEKKEYEETEKKRKKKKVVEAEEVKRVERIVSEQESQDTQRKEKIGEEIRRNEENACKTIGDTTTKNMKPDERTEPAHEKEKKEAEGKVKAIDTEFPAVLQRAIPTDIIIEEEKGVEEKEEGLEEIQEKRDEGEVVEIERAELKAQEEKKKIEETKKEVCVVENNRVEEKNKGKAQEEGVLKEDKKENNDKQEEKEEEKKENEKVVAMKKEIFKQRNLLIGTESCIIWFALILIHISSHSMPPTAWRVRLFILPLWASISSYVLYKTFDKKVQFGNTYFALGMSLISFYLSMISVAYMGSLLALFCLITPTVVAASILWKFSLVLNDPHGYHLFHGISVTSGTVVGSLISVSSCLDSLIIFISLVVAMVLALRITSLCIEFVKQLHSGLIKTLVLTFVIYPVVLAITFVLSFCALYFVFGLAFFYIFGELVTSSVWIIVRTTLQFLMLSTTIGFVIFTGGPFLLLHVEGRTGLLVFKSLRVLLVLWVSLGALFVNIPVYE